MNGIVGIILTVIIFVAVFFGPELVKWAGRKFGVIDSKIMLMSVITVGVASATGLIVMLPMGLFGKIVMCLLSIGLVILMTLFVLSLLFVATIPEEMEKEDERK